MIVSFLSSQLSFFSLCTPPPPNSELKRLKEPLLGASVVLAWTIMQSTNLLTLDGTELADAIQNRRCNIGSGRHYYADS